METISKPYAKTYRNLLVVRAYLGGKHPADIAREFGISRQRVDQILSRANELLYDEVKPSTQRYQKGWCGYSLGKKRDPICKKPVTKALYIDGVTDYYISTCDDHAVAIVERGKSIGIPVVRIENIIG